MSRRLGAGAESAGARVVMPRSVTPAWTGTVPEGAAELDGRAERALVQPGPGRRWGTRGDGSGAFISSYQIMDAERCRDEAEWTTSSECGDSECRDGRLERRFSAGGGELGQRAFLEATTASVTRPPPSLRPRPRHV